MFYDRIYRPLTEFMNDGIDRPCCTFGDETIDYATLARYMAPAMDEFDAVDGSVVPLLMTPDVFVLSACWACLFCGKTLLPISPKWTEDQQNKILQDCDSPKLLTSQRIQYFFWKTFEDAMARIDNGLLFEHEDKPALLLYHFKDENDFNCNTLLFKELPEMFQTIAHSTEENCTSIILESGLFPFLQPIACDLSRFWKKHFR